MRGMHSSGCDPISSFIISNMSSPEPAYILQSRQYESRRSFPANIKPAPFQFTTAHIVLAGIFAALTGILLAALIIRHFRKSGKERDGINSIDSTETWRSRKRGDSATTPASDPSPILCKETNHPDHEGFDLEVGLEQNRTAFPYLTSLNNQAADITTRMSLQAGINSVWRRTQNRARQDSGCSETTGTTFTDSLYSASVPRSSTTSLAAASEVDEEMYEVKRAQTRSMEVKRGILLACRSSTVPQLPPKVVISISTSLCNSGEGMSVDEGLLHHDYPSAHSLNSSTSSVSVDLDEFPVPPVHVTTG